MPHTSIPDYILAGAQSFFTETLLGVTFCILLLVGLAKTKNSSFVAGIAFIGLVISALHVGHHAHLTGTSIFSGMYTIDGFSMFFKYVILGTSMLIVLFSTQSQELARGTKSLGEYYALLIAMTLGMVLMTGASNLLMMYIALELTSISSYILAGYTKEAKDSSEASLKYVIYGALSSGLMLYGISILYGLTGSTDIYGVNRALATGEANTVALIIAGILILAGFGYKISAVPFHFWTPDVYEGAPITITAFLSVASKAAGFAMMIRFLKVSFIDVAGRTFGAGMWATFPGFEWNQILAVLSVLTMTLGNLVALWQNNLKRMLAYSSIAHAGYMLMGLVVLSNEGIAAVLIYFVVYLFMNLGAFYAVMIIANKIGSEDIDHYRGLGYRSPLIGLALTLFLFSLTGIPPTAGFVGKLYLFAALINAKWIWLAIVGALNSVVSLYYYIRVVRNMYLKQPEGAPEPLRLSIVQAGLLLLLLIPTLLLGIYFSPLVEYAQASISIFGAR